MQCRGGSTTACMASPLPLGLHRRNFWVAGSEAAIYIASLQLVGPMTMIPFLFKRVGIASHWLGLFTISALIMAVGTPLGSAIAGGRAWKKSFCVRTGFFQRLPFILVPIGAMFWFDRPVTLLLLLAVAWALSSFAAGCASPIYNVVITNGTRETSWGRLMSTRHVLGAVLGFGLTGFVWCVNRAVPPPSNYIVLGWTGFGLLYVSLYVFTRFREVPIRQELVRDTGGLLGTVREIRSIWREDARVRWFVFGRILRSFGYVLGTYMTAVAIVRCALTDKDMWIPVLAFSVARVLTGSVAGWFIDRFGAKPALVLSALLISGGSLMIMSVRSIPSFLAVVGVCSLAGSLLMNGLPTMAVKMTSRDRVPAYLSTLSLASAPGVMLVALLGMFLVWRTGYEVVFWLSSAGTLVAAAVLYVKLPHIKHAPDA